MCAKVLLTHCSKLVDNVVMKICQNFVVTSLSQQLGKTVGTILDIGLLEKHRYKSIASLLKVVFLLYACMFTL